MNPEGLKSMRFPGDQADVAHALSSDMAQQIIAGMVHGTDRHKDTEENTEGEETSWMARKEMLHCLGEFEELVANRNDRDHLDYVHKIRHFY